MSSTEFVTNPDARAWRAAPGSEAAVAFHRTLPGYAPTPLRELPELAQGLGVGRVLVKDESDRFGLPAFKVLGASWAVHRALAETAGAPDRALVTASDGNHGRALARTGRLLGHPARVYLPLGVHPAAAQAIRDEGAQVVQVDGDYDEAVRRAADDAERTDSLLVQDTAWPGYEQIPAWIVQGYGTLLHEIDAQLAEAGLRADLVAVPVGVGSLAQAVVEHYRRPGRDGDDAGAAGYPALLGVEPTAAAGLLASLRARELISVPTSYTAMAGLNCGTPSSAAWPSLSGGLDAAVAIDDRDAAAALRDLRAAGVDAGPCGAATLAGLRALVGTPAFAELGLGPDATVVLLATEGSAANPADPDDPVDVDPGLEHSAAANPTLRIDGERLWAGLHELAAIGAYDDPETGLVGVNRQSLTDEDSRGRHLVSGWMREAGLEVRIDAIGNVIGRRAGTDPDAAPVMAGSHIDSVGTAGAFDGCLGVLSALEVVRALDERGIRTRRPIEIGFFTEEEGVRFGVDMLGSAVAAGRIALADALDITDSEGVRLGDELVRTGWDGEHPERLEAPHAYVECHIEQGPVLAAEGFTVGVVTGVQGISWQRIVVRGRAAHAGTTPTELRVDAGLAAARIVCHVRELVDSQQFGQLRGTVGRLVAHPGLPNVVPERVELTVDLRNPDDAALAAAEDALARFVAGLQEAQPGLHIETHRMARTDPVPFDAGVQKTIAGAIEDLGLEHMSLMSGAGHDAQEIAAIAPAAMIFVRGEYDGISHNPREYSTPQACAAGIDVLATTLLRLANEE